MVLQAPQRPCTLCLGLATAPAVGACSELTHCSLCRALCLRPRRRGCRARPASLSAASTQEQALCLVASSGRGLEMGARLVSSALNCLPRVMAVFVL